MNDPELHKLQELAREQQVLLLGAGDGKIAYRMAFSAARIDCVDTWDNTKAFYDNSYMYQEQIFLHIGEPKNIVQLFLPNFDLAFIESTSSLYADLDLVFDKVKYGGWIAIQTTAPLYADLQEWLKDHCTFIMTSGESEYHPPKLENMYDLTYFQINWKS